MMDWKDLLALVTGISGLLFSLAAFKRAKAAEERASRVEQQSLTNAIVGERERALLELNAMRASWQTQKAVIGALDPNDAEFAALMTKAISGIDFVEKLVKIKSASIATHDDLTRFRTEVLETLQKQRSQFTVAESLFAERKEQLKAPRKDANAPDDA